MRFPRWFDYLSPGAWIILAGAVASAIAYVAWPVPKRAGRELWLFSPPNLAGYEIAAREWKAVHQDSGNHLRPVLFHFRALEGRLMGAVAADAPIAVVMGRESSVVERACADALGCVGS